MPTALSKWDVWAPNGGNSGVLVIQGDQIKIEMKGGSLVLDHKTGGPQHIFSPIGYIRCEKSGGDWHVLPTFGMEKQYFKEIRASYIQISDPDGTALFMIADSTGKSPIAIIPQSAYAHIRYAGRAIDE